MPGFDGKGNGKKDVFGHFMDNKVVSETSEDKNNPSSDSVVHQIIWFQLGKIFADYLQIKRRYTVN